jgi:methyltransferase
MLIADQYFLGLMVYTILQRLSEVMIAKRNTKRLLERGAVEFGASHYPYMVMMHTAFFLSMIVEYLTSQAQDLNLALVLAFGIAQAIRFWVMRVLGDRWTTRILVIKGERLVARGPYRYLSHPNYLVVVLEIVALPLAFGLWITAILFSILNAIMLLAVRIPAEEKALRWSQVQTSEVSLNPN